eukprot:14384583-Alexandrium_andersonii.AAC.1
MPKKRQFGTPLRLCSSHLRGVCPRPSQMSPCSLRPMSSTTVRSTLWGLGTTNTTIQGSGSILSYPWVIEQGG